MCDYTIITDDGYYVALTFDDFDLEDDENCAYDVLNVRDWRYCFNGEGRLKILCPL